MVSISARNRQVLHNYYPLNGGHGFLFRGDIEVCFPYPEATAHIVATGEIIGGLLLLFGLFTRYVSFYFIIQMIVAVLSTKITLYLGTPPLPLPAVAPKVG